MYYVFAGDFHDNYKTLEYLLNTYSRSFSQLVLLGDFFDSRGNKGNAKEMANLLTKLNRGEYYFYNKPIILLGNHDDFLLGTVKQNDLDYQTWLSNGGKHTLNQLGYYHRFTLKGVSEFLLSEYPDVIDLLNKSKLFYEDENVFAVHAGLNWELENPRETSKDDMLWIRDDYLGDLPDNPKPNKLDKIIVTGHTPVQNYQDNNSIITMVANDYEAPRYLIDGGSNSGARNGKVNILTLKI